MRGPIRIGVVIVTYNSQDVVGRCLQSVLAANHDGLMVEVVVVDNDSADRTRAVVSREFSQAKLIVNATNSGFAAGINLGLRALLKQHPDLDYVCALNPDTTVDTNWLAPMAAYLETHPDVAAVQPKVLLTGSSDGGAAPRFDTAGNRSHYLGFGFVEGHAEADEGQFDDVRRVDFTSGACMLVRAPLLAQVGGFDEQMFLYLEDMELCWRFKTLGYEVHYVPHSKIWHLHDPVATFRHYDHLERNRWWVLLAYYKVRTLLLIAPPLALMEVGTVYHASKSGQLSQKLRAYRDMLTIGPNGWWARLRKKRRMVQSQRTISDRDLVGGFAGMVTAQHVNKGLMRRAINPLLGAWWRYSTAVLRW